MQIVLHSEVGGSPRRKKDFKKDEKIQKSAEKLISKLPNQNTAYNIGVPLAIQDQVQTQSDNLDDMRTSKEIRLAELYFGKIMERKKIIADWIKDFRRMQQEHTLEQWLADPAQARFKQNYEEF